MAIGLVLIILFLDQSTKYLISHTVTLHQSIPVLPGIFHITFVHNTGAAFGILKNQVPVFIFISACVIVFILFQLRRPAARRRFRDTLALSLILAGAVGNLSDRLFWGYVIDFLDFRVWPVFNVADSAITIGAVLLGYSLLFGDKSQKQEGKAN